MNPKLRRQIISTTSIMRCEFPSKLGRLLEKPPPIPGHATPGNRDNWVALEFPQLLISALFTPKFSRISILWSAQLCFRGKKPQFGASVDVSCSAGRRSNHRNLLTRVVVSFCSNVCPPKKWNLRGNEPLWPKRIVFTLNLQLGEEAWPLARRKQKRKAKKSKQERKEWGKGEENEK